MLNNIPDELKSHPNFVLWRLEVKDGRETKVPYCPHTGKHASVNNPSSWGTFQQVVSILPISGMSGIGFVMTPETGYVCIDIDDPYKLNPDGTPKFPNPDELLQRQIGIAKTFDTYAEISPSGKGLHIWLRGTIPSGRDRHSVGLYPSGRYMTMTGKIYNSSPIRSYPDLLDQLWSELGDEQAQPVNEQAGTVNENQTDSEVLEAAYNAANGLKFKDLYCGDWQQYYPSQSEADFALVDMLAYYTKNRVQIIRMFRNSALGQRKKALRADYCDKMITRSFDREPLPVDMSALHDSMQKAFNEKKQAKPVKEKKQAKTVKEAKQVETVNDDDQEEESAPLKPRKEIYTAPPGLIGDLAGFIYAAAPRPVPEIALAGAIGLMSGVCGRAYNISGTGLNQYTFLIAKTGRGKEAMGSGISKILTALEPTVPDAKMFIGPSKIASPEALIKYMSKKSKSFVSVMGEFADTLKRMSNDSRNPVQQGVKQMMLDVYNKSGNGARLGSLIYSAEDKNTDSLLAPAFSILGEATPEKFYELLSDDMIAEGLLSRFSIIEYQGKRPQLNKEHLNAVIPTTLLEQFGQVAAHCVQLNNSNRVINVGINQEAAVIFDQFDKYCDDQINHGNGVAQELWNRAHVKSLKLAGLLAVGSNYIHPCVSAEQCNWAIRIIVDDIENILYRFESGEVGCPQNQNKQLIDLKKAFVWYLKKPWKDIESYAGATEATHKAKAVPHSFLTGFCRMRTSFKQDRLGPVQAIKTLITSLLESGEIQELGVAEKNKAGIGLNGKVYVVLNIRSFK